MIIQSENNEILQNDSAYQDFLKENPGRGTLKIRTSSASEAMPIKDVTIIVSKKIGNNTIIFYEGLTDNSGMINDIKLPTPKAIQNDEEQPNFTSYQLHAIYEPDKFDKYYEVSLCCGFSVIQYINITPNVETEVM